ERRELHPRGRRVAGLQDIPRADAGTSGLAGHGGVVHRAARAGFIGFGVDIAAEGADEFGRPGIASGRRRGMSSALGAVAVSGRTVAVAVSIMAGVVLAIGRLPVLERRSLRRRDRTARNRPRDTVHFDPMALTPCHAADSLLPRPTDDPRRAAN